VAGLEAKSRSPPASRVVTHPATILRGAGPGIDGLIPYPNGGPRELHPGKIVSTSQEVEVQVLEVIRSAPQPLAASNHAHPGVFVEKYPSRTTRGRGRVRTSGSGLFLGSTAMSTAWCICPILTERPRAVIARVQEGDRFAPGARCRSRMTHLARHQAARRRSSPKLRQSRRAAGVT